MQTVKTIYANTTSKEYTHFISAVNLIQNAREDFKVPSENWPYPTQYRIGSPETLDRYYAELWTDGIDWQSTYWIIESINLEEPQIYPLLYIDSTELRFNKWDFSRLMYAILYARRDFKWIKKQDYKFYCDTVWSFVVRDVPDYADIKKFETANLVKVYIEHASQPRVNFYINIDFLPMNSE